MQLGLKPQEKPPVDQRIADILAAARTAFTEKGFDGASMQDLARAAGMSVGNFYRYFPSKAAIVEALIALDLAEMERDFSSVLSSANPLESLRQQARARIQMHQNCDDGQLWAEITATALRKPEIGFACGLMETTVAGYLLQVFAASTGLDAAETKRRFGGHASFFVLLVKSSAMMAPEAGQARDDLNALILRTIDQHLDEIANTGAKG